MNFFPHSEVPFLQLQYIQAFKGASPGYSCSFGDLNLRADPPHSKRNGTFLTFFFLPERI